MYLGNRGKQLFCVVMAAYCVNVWAQLPVVTPEPRHMQWNYGAERQVALTAFDRIVLEDPALTPAADIFNAGLVARGAAPLPVVVAPDALATEAGGVWVGTSEAPSALTVVNGMPAPASEEGFRVFVSEDWIIVAGEGLPGAAYGLGALLACISEDAETVPAVGLSDWPGVDLRAVYLDGLPSAEQADELAALRINAVICRDERLFHLDDPNVAGDVASAAALCRARHVEFIPLLDLVTNAEALLASEPSMAEGIDAGHLFDVLDGRLAPVEPWVGPLPPLINVLITPAAPFSVWSGETPRIPGEDYALPVSANFPFAEELAEVFTLPGGGLEEGERVLAHYTAALPGTADVCTSEPLWEMAVHDAIEQTVTLLAPRYLHIGLDAPTAFGTDGRCRQRAISNAELLIQAIAQLDAAAKSAGADTRLMAWADPLDPFHGGDPFELAAAAAGLPQDAVVCPRYYQFPEDDGAAADALAHFAHAGLAVAGVCGNNEESAVFWSTTAAGMPGEATVIYGGVFDSPADPWAALPLFAAAAWGAEAAVPEPEPPPPLVPPDESEAVPLGVWGLLGAAAACAALGFGRLNAGPRGNAGGGFASGFRRR